MSQFNTTSTMDGLFKSIYGESQINLVPEANVLLNLIKFRPSEKVGKDYKVPVVLSNEQGATYLAAGDGVTTLNDSIALTSKEATVNGAQLIMRGALDMESASKAAAAGKGSFKDATQMLVENLTDSASKRLELMFLYGRSGLAVVSSLSSQEITLTLASFAEGIWAGMEGAVIDVYQSNGSVRQAGLVISSVDLDNRILTVTGTTTGIASTDIIYFKGAYGKECYGLDSIITNTGSLFGVDASAYALWKGSSYAAGSAALTMSKVLSAVSKAIGKGGLSEECIVLVNPKTWNNLNSDQAALRQYVDDKSEAKSGFEAITYRGPNGKISVIAHSYVKEGEAFVLPPKRVKRVGSQDLSFINPTGQVFMAVPDKNAFECRIYGNQSIFVETPAKCVKITGIVNS